MNKEQIYLEAKSELQAMIDKKKSEGDGLRNFDVWELREKNNKARNAWRAEQRKIKVTVYKSQFCEQLAQAIEDKRGGDPLTNQQAQAGFLLGLDTALEVVKGMER